MTGLGSQRMQCCPDRVETVQGVLQFRELFCSSESFAVQRVVLQFRELLCSSGSRFAVQGVVLLRPQRQSKEVNFDFFSPEHDDD